MDVWVNYVGFFPTLTAATAWEVAALHARRFDLILDENQDGQVSYGRYPQPSIVLRREDSEWSNFGVCGLRPEFLDAAGAGEVVPWLLSISDDLRCGMARSFSEETFLKREETVLGPDCLDWLQYLGPDVAKRWSLPFLQKGPFHDVVGFKSGGVGLALGPSPFEQWMSVRAAADYLGLALRPRMGTNIKGQPVEREWR